MKVELCPVIFETREQRNGELHLKCNLKVHLWNFCSFYELCNIFPVSKLNWTCVNYYHVKQRRAVSVGINFINLHKTSVGKLNERTIVNTQINTIAYLRCSWWLNTNIIGNASEHSSFLGGSRLSSIIRVSRQPFRLSWLVFVLSRSNSSKVTVARWSHCF